MASLGIIWFLVREGKEACQERLLSRALMRGACCGRRMAVASGVSPKGFGRPAKPPRFAFPPAPRFPPRQVLEKIHRDCSILAARPLWRKISY